MWLPKLKRRNPSDCEASLVRLAIELLHEQQRLLDRAMTATDLERYDIRSLQVRDVLRHLGTGKWRMVTRPSLEFPRVGRYWAAAHALQVWFGRVNALVDRLFLPAPEPQRRKRSSETITKPQVSPAARAGSYPQEGPANGP